MIKRKSISLSWFIIFFLFLIKANYSQQTISSSILHDGIQRSYILYVPQEYSPNQAIPLLLNFHGYGSNASQQMIYGDFRSIADTAVFLVVHPLGTEDDLGNLHWNVGWGGSTVDDVGFTNALIDSLKQDYNIEENRIYSTGMSNGGFMSYKLACELSDRITAVASVTGSMTENQIQNCNSQHPIPILEIHGTADDVVPYEGNYMFLSIPDVLTHWVEFNNCASSPIINEIPDYNPNDGSTVTHYLYDNGSNGSVVEHFKVNNGTHTWPGSIFDLGGTNYDIDASSEIWKFLSRYRLDELNNLTSVFDHRNIKNSIEVYPNPFNSYINISRDHFEQEKYELVSVSGHLIKTGFINSRHQKIKTDELSKGVYILRISDQIFILTK